jgi:Flp pilus assembly CpaE family ATPase
VSGAGEDPETLAARPESASPRAGTTEADGDAGFPDLTELARGVRAFTPQADEVNWGARSRGSKGAALICFLPVQGGNGASTVSLHVAEAISRNVKGRVLLADFDFHSGTLAFRLGLKPSQTLADIFACEKAPESLWEEAACRWRSLDVVVAPPSNKSLPATSLERMPEVFASALRRYPYVIVDHPDAIYSSSRHIFTLADLVYLVCTPEITSLHLARRKVQQIRSMGVASDRLRLIVNRAGSWGSLGIEDVGRIVGVPVSWALDNDYAALRDATWNGGLVKEGSALARQLFELGSSVMRSDSLADVASKAWDEVGVGAV